jgi:outer membrane protein assembly factor BamB
MPVSARSLKVLLAAHLFATCLLAASLLATVALADEQEWTRFRGPNGTGVSTAKGIPTAWTEKDYNWKATLPGVGHSSPVIWGDKVFVTSADSDTAERIVICLDAGSGKSLWEQRYPSRVHPKHKFNTFASSTPAVDAGQVYVSWSTPEHYSVAALDHGGKPRWRVDLGAVVSQHSTGVSPIVFDDMVIVANDQDGRVGENKNIEPGVSFLVALNASDGLVRWRTDRKSEVVSYSTPCVYQSQETGLPELIFNSQAHGMTSVDPYSGQVNWELGVFDKRAVSSPVVAAGLIFGTTGSGGGGNYLVAVRPGKNPEVAYEITQMAPYVPTLVAKDELLFLWGDGGVVSCVDAANGKVHWRQRVGGNYSGSPVVIDDRVYCIAEDGEVVVLDAKPEYKLLARNPLDEASKATPAVAGGRLYLRTASHLISLGGR